MIYDDQCSLCLGAVGKVRQLDRLGLVELVPLSRAADSFGHCPSTEERLRKQLHLVTSEGKIYRGAEAVGVLAALFPESKLLGHVILLPFIRPLARWAYRIVARHRLKISRLVSVN
ncbi:MAG: DUF393 domain-containing protein [Candidatus Zixiibacteriota bacterium]|nr:MAG: DUF393 domain-containing protein [candidate division Zixibacteria bacterium]